MHGHSSTPSRIENRSIPSKSTTMQSLQERFRTSLCSLEFMNTPAKIADSGLIANYPVGCMDILAAERIFGTNLGALKGKTVYHPSVPVYGRIEGVPPALLK
jgi:hypothetical protein